MLLATNYAAAVTVALEQWLSGGWRAPYHEILVLVVLVGALGHPARRFAPLGAFIAVVALLPLAYDADRTALLGVAADLVLWAVLAAFCLVLMQRVRAQRVATERLAQVDALTLLGNRRAFEAQAAAALEGPVVLAVGDPLRMTFGWAVHEPGMDVDALVAAADAGLLRRKAARRAVVA